MPLNQTSQSLSDTVSQWVTFRLGDELYGIDVLRVQEVLRMTEISSVPGAPDFVLGIINLRGRVVTVVDTRVRFGLPSKPVGEGSRIIVVEVSDKVIGLLVDYVAEVAYVPDSQIETVPNVGADDGNRFVSGVCNRDEELLIMLDLAKLVNVD
jgi:purine-binding chemotaxis protein CheW